MGGRHLELVCPQLIDVGACSGLWLIPEAELKKHLISPGEQHLAPLLSELQVLLWAGQSGHGSQEVPLSQHYVPWVIGGSPQQRAESELIFREVCRVAADIPCYFLACSCSP